MEIDPSTSNRVPEEVLDIFVSSFCDFRSLILRRTEEGESISALGSSLDNELHRREDYILIFSPFAFQKCKTFRKKNTCITIRIYSHLRYLVMTRKRIATGTPTRSPAANSSTNPRGPEAELSWYGRYR
jgi:hypothetical protein